MVTLLCCSLSYGQTATNFTENKEEVRDLFESLWDEFKSLDNYHCYRRAHILSYEMSKKNIISDKVFFFNGDKLMLPMGWYYHVAPMVYYKNSPVVMDKGLFDGATHLDDWLYAFSEGKKCKQIFSMNEYKANKALEDCMYLISPMYNYGPKDLSEDSKTSFVESDLDDMLFALPKRKRKKYRYIYNL